MMQRVWSRSPSKPVARWGKQVKKSGREDLNLRPHGPEPCALAGLRYAPYESIILHRCTLCKRARMSYNYSGVVPL